MLWGLRPVNQQAAYGLAVERLKHQIHLGLLLPEERLPAERKLCEEVGISRVTLREALRVLESERYIYVRRGAQGGTFVSPVVVLDDIARRKLALNLATVMRALEFRQANEMAAVQFACERRTLPETKRMKAALQDMAQAADAATFRRACTLFRLALGSACHNPFLSEALEYGLAEMFFPSSVFDDSEFTERLRKYHQQLLTAIDERDKTRASQALQELISADWHTVNQLQNLRIPDFQDIGRR